MIGHSGLRHLLVQEDRWMQHLPIRHATTTTTPTAPPATAATTTTSTTTTSSSTTTTATATATATTTTTTNTMSGIVIAYDRSETGLKQVWNRSETLKTFKLRAFPLLQFAFLLDSSKLCCYLGKKK